MLSLWSICAALLPTTAAALLPTISAGQPSAATTAVWFGEGCFWERQWAYVNLELDKSGPFARANASVSSRVGYAGSLKTAGSGTVCYLDYEELGHSEVVIVDLDADSRAAGQFAALAADFFGSFTFLPGAGFVRPDPNDLGAAYRVTVGIPGGVGGALYPLLAAANEALRTKHNMTSGAGEMRSSRLPLCPQSWHRR